jgi:hypothetical protein
VAWRGMVRRGMAWQATSGWVIRSSQKSGAHIGWMWS